MLFVMVPQQTIDGFTEFWKRYPNRQAKKDAQRAWTKLHPSPELQAEMFAAIEAQKAWRAQGALLNEWRPSWPFPATWLNGERWTDQVAETTAEPVACQWCGLTGPHGKVECNTRWLAQEKAKARA